MDPHQQTLQQALQHHRKNELDHAESLYRGVLAVQPEHPDALGMLGQLLVQTGRSAEGVDLLQRAIAAKPREPAFHAALGQALAELGRLDEAIAAQQAAVQLVPTMAALHYNLGTSLKARGRLNEALESFQAAIRLQPLFAQAHVNLGNVLLAQGRLEQAIAAYREGAGLAPSDAVAHNNLGNALKAAGMMEEAEISYNEAIRLSPPFAEAWNNLADVCLLTGRLDEALAHGSKAADLSPKNAVIQSNCLAMLHFHPAYDGPMLKARLDAWREKFAGPLKSQIVPYANDRSPNRPLRIGYVSSDFRDHVVGRNLFPLLQQHDRAGFEIYCYAGVTAPDHLTEKFRNLSSQFVLTAGMSNEQLAEQIRRDRIDILVDLALHMAGSRLLVFARKPAPVQVTFAGYPGSTGLDTIDYRLTDPLLDPPGMDESIYSEISVRLPSFWCYDPLEEPPPVGELPATFSPGVTFGCLNNFCKINEMTLALWARVLASLPESRLMLLTREGPHRAKVMGFMLRRGVAPEQIRFQSKLPRPLYLELHQQIDIGLDTLPYNGHTTTLDALFMGVPVVTLPGNTVVGRAGVSQLTNLGMPELIAQSPDDFVRIATDLARDLPRLKALRAGLRSRMQASPLMDARAFAAGIESAYRGIWRKWRHAQSPIS